MAAAGHNENDTDSAIELISPVSCPVPDRSPGARALSGYLKINVTPGAIAHRIYEKPVVEESYSCNFELNPLYESSITVNGLTVSGRGDNGEARILELTGHPFFFATLFRPQLASSETCPHPLVTAYLSAALKAKTANAVVG